MGIGIFKNCQGNYPQAFTSDPNHKKFEIVRRSTINGHLMLMVVYRNCTNYEGKKILVFHKDRLPSLDGSPLDPHFQEQGPSPVARFRPDINGWYYATKFCQEILR